MVVGITIVHINPQLRFFVPQATTLALRLEATTPTAVQTVTTTTQAPFRLHHQPETGMGNV